VASFHTRAPPAPTAPAESVRFGPFAFHISRGELRRGDELIHLTDREKDILRLLAASPGETVPRLTLAGSGAAAGERAVDVQVNRLRRKIENDPANPLFLQAVRGIGYRLVVVI
jgi:two-component system phosphate regulon response regulator OmpR